MTDLIAHDDDSRWGRDREEFFTETERRDWENQSDRWPEANDHPEAGVAYAQRTTATASWQRSVLIIAALSAVAWAAVILILIAALSTLQPIEPNVVPEQAVQFLRARAGRLRGIAGTARTAISDPLRRLADEMEARADELEREHAPSDADHGR